MKLNKQVAREQRRKRAKELKEENLKWQNSEEKNEEKE
jgi:hypothetical protein